MRLFLFLKSSMSLLCLPFATAFLSPVRATPSSLPAVAQFAPEAASLFGNMITPASIMAGALVPIGFTAGLGFDSSSSSESKFARTLRHLFPYCCVAGFTSQLMAVMWAVVSVNQLTENKPALAQSVWELLQRDYAMEWAAVNGHFVVGLLLFMWIIATKGECAVSTSVNAWVKLWVVFRVADDLD